MGDLGGHHGDVAGLTVAEADLQVLREPCPHEHQREPPGRSPGGGGDRVQPQRFGAIVRVAEAPCQRDGGDPGAEHGHVHGADGAHGHHHAGGVSGEHLDAARQVGPEAHLQVVWEALSEHDDRGPARGRAHRRGHRADAQRHGLVVPVAQPASERRRLEAGASGHDRDGPGVACRCERQHGRGGDHLHILRLGAAKGQPQPVSEARPHERDPLATGGRHLVGEDVGQAQHLVHRVDHLRVDEPEGIRQHRTLPARLLHRDHHGARGRGRSHGDDQARSQELSGLGRLSAEAHQEIGVEAGAEQRYGLPTEGGALHGDGPQQLQRIRIRVGHIGEAALEHELLPAGIDDDHVGPTRTSGRDDDDQRTGRDQLHDLGGLPLDAHVHALAQPLADERHLDASTERPSVGGHGVERTRGGHLGRAVGQRVRQGGGLLVGPRYRQVDLLPLAAGRSHERQTCTFPIEHLHAGRGLQAHTQRGLRHETGAREDHQVSAVSVHLLGGDRLEGEIDRGWIHERGRRSPGQRALQAGLGPVRAQHGERGAGALLARRGHKGQGRAQSVEHLDARQVLLAEADREPVAEPGARHHDQGAAVGGHLGGLQPRERQPLLAGMGQLGYDGGTIGEPFGQGGAGAVQVGDHHLDGGALLPWRGHEEQRGAEAVERLDITERDATDRDRDPLAEARAHRHDRGAPVRRDLRRPQRRQRQRPVPRVVALVAAGSARTPDGGLVVVTGGQRRGQQGGHGDDQRGAAESRPESATASRSGWIRC